MSDMWLGVLSAIGYVAVWLILPVLASLIFRKLNEPLRKDDSYLLMGFAAFWPVTLPLAVVAGFASLIVVGCKKYAELLVTKEVRK